MKFQHIYLLALFCLLVCALKAMFVEKAFDCDFVNSINKDLEGACKDPITYDNFNFSELARQTVKFVNRIYYLKDTFFACPSDFSK